MSKAKKSSKNNGKTNSVNKPNPTAVKRSNAITVILIILIIVAVIISTRHNAVEDDIFTTKDPIIKSASMFTKNSKITIPEVNIFDLEIKSGETVMQPGIDFTVTYSGLNFTIYKGAESALPDGPITISYLVPAVNDTAIVVNNKAISFTKLQNYALQAKSAGAKPELGFQMAFQMAIDDAMIDSEIDKLELVSEKELDMELANLKLHPLYSLNNISDETAKASLKHDIGYYKILSENIPTLAVADSEITTYYQENFAGQTMPGQVETSHILICFKGKPNCALNISAEDAVMILNEIKGRLMAGEDFNELAMQYSVDPSVAQNAGYLGMQPKGTFVPEYEAVAFNLSAGDISAPFETAYGFHIIKVHNKIPDYNAPPLEALKLNIQQQLMLMKMTENQEAVTTYMNGLRESAEIHYSTLV